MRSDEFKANNSWMDDPEERQCFISSWQKRIAETGSNVEKPLSEVISNAIPRHEMIRAKENYLESELGLSEADHKSLYDLLFDFGQARSLLSWLLDRHRTDKDSWLMQYRDGTLRYWILLLLLADDFFGPAGSDDEAGDSIQSRFLKHCKDSGDTKVREQFIRERAAAWRLVVGESEKYLLGTTKPAAVQFEQRIRKARLRTLSRYSDPGNTPYLAENPSLSISSGYLPGEEWEPDELADALYQERRKGTHAGLNTFTLMVGKLWVHPDCPLWLMNPKTAFEIAHGCYRQIYERSGNENRVTSPESYLRKIRKDYGLARFRPPVIVDVIGSPVRLSSDERIIIGAFVFGEIYREALTDAPVNPPPDPEIS